VIRRAGGRLATLLRSGNRLVRRGQILVLGVVIFFLFFIVATVLIDVYTLFEARNWGYRVAQQAALAGTSFTPVKWMFTPVAVDPSDPTPTLRPDNCMLPIPLTLDLSEAEDAANNLLDAELAARGVTPLAREVRIHQTNGETSIAFPPEPVRLGVSSPDWYTEYPAVGVYFSFRAQTFLLSTLGITPGVIHVFAAAEAATPLVCP